MVNLILKFNRFNIVRFRYNQKGQYFITCFKTLHNEQFEIQLFIPEEKHRSYINDSFIKIIKNYYISKSDVTSNVISLDEEQINNTEFDDNNLNSNNSNQQRIRIVTSDSILIHFHHIHYSPVFLIN